MSLVKGKDWNTISVSGESVSQGFKENRVNSAVALFIGTLMSKKVLHIATRLDVEDLKTSNGEISSSKQEHSVTYKTVLE